MSTPTFFLIRYDKIQRCQGGGGVKFFFFEVTFLLNHAVVTLVFFTVQEVEGVVVGNLQFPENRINFLTIACSYWLKWASRIKPNCVN